MITDCLYKHRTLHEEFIWCHLPKWMWLWRYVPDKIWIPYLTIEKVFKDPINILLAVFVCFIKGHQLTSSCVIYDDRPITQWCEYCGKIVSGEET